MNNTLAIGDIYEHYKKKSYKILGIARHTETLEEMVIYQALYDCPQFGHNPIWARPKSMFLETIIIDNVEVPRFRRKENVQI